MRQAPWRHLRPVAQDLKEVYRAKDEAAAPEALVLFKEWWISELLDDFTQLQTQMRGVDTALGTARGSLVHSQARSAG